MIATKEQLEELMFRQEELDPELEPWLEHEGPFGTCLKHPLVFSIVHPPQMNAFANERLKQQKKALQLAVANEKWRTAVFLHERPHRLEAFMAISWHLEGPDYWDLLGDVWSDTENARQNWSEWREMLTADPEGREMMSSEDVRSMLTAPSEEFGLAPMTRIYRGFCYDDALRGFSWTLDRARAKWFAQRLRDPNTDPPAKVATGWVARENVIAYITGRNEEEFVVLPEHVTDLEVEEL